MTESSRFTGFVRDMKKSSRFTGFVRDMKKSSRFTGFLLALLGAMVLSNNLDKPRVAALRGSDVLGLVTSGMAFGVAFIMLIGRFRIRNE